MRSLLFVPGDAPDKMQKALHSGADSLILDLEDSVTIANKQRAREEVAGFLQTARRQPDSPSLIVRINALSAPGNLADKDLDTVMTQSPDMIMLSKAQSGADVQWLGAKLATHEAIKGSSANKTRIIALVTETPSSLFTLGTYKGSSERLAALAWGAEDLAAATGSHANRDEHGNVTEPYKMVRHLALFAAAAAEVQPIDGVYTNLRDLNGARHEAEAASRDGFTGKLAIHPSQVPVYNDVFRPSRKALDEAQKIIEAFNRSGVTSGVIDFNGTMLDRPHLARAQRLLATAKVK